MCSRSNRLRTIEIRKPRAQEHDQDEFLQKSTHSTTGEKIMLAEIESRRQP
jgi:hypothetical protein